MVSRYEYSLIHQSLLFGVGGVTTSRIQPPASLHLVRKSKCSSPYGVCDVLHSAPHHFAANILMRRRRCKQHPDTTDLRRSLVFELS
jgi:hypothetical protein